jgi:glycosyltransferase involved in cell wall biosynthesis
MYNYIRLNKRKQFMKKVAAIIPAYNEEKTIEGVIKTARKSHLVNRIIVVDDGSSDKTAQVAKRAGGFVISFKENQGKGQALVRGVEMTDAKTLLFLDGDLIGLTTRHLEKLLKPVLEGEVDMSVGAVDRSGFGKIGGWLVQKSESPFSGIRVLKRDFWEKIPQSYKRKFYIESAITHFAKKNNLKVRPIVLEGVRHIIKEKKLGLFFGLQKRAQMICEIVLINIILKIH